jgi:hypothetical protein
MRRMSNGDSERQYALHKSLTSLTHGKAVVRLIMPVELNRKL